MKQWGAYRGNTRQFSIFTTVVSYAADRYLFCCCILEFNEAREIVEIYGPFSFWNTSALRYSCEENGIILPQIFLLLLQLPKNVLPLTFSVRFYFWKQTIHSC